MTTSPTPPPGPEDNEWDALYSAEERIWSGEPNGALVAEAGSLTVGRVLDVGCGEGADSVWLARRGWDVTALDVSSVALQRAARHARDARASIRWHHGGLLSASFEPFDLVSAQYPALRKTSGHDAERALITMVAAGGILLVVHHVVDSEHAQSHGFDPAEYVSPADVRSQLDGNWEVVFDESRPRSVSGGAGAHHTHDVVLRAQRL